MPEITVSVIGYRWVSSGGANACDRCRALHGQEFFKNPEPGQNPLSDMPEPPLHPNCRCKTMPLVKANIEDLGHSMDAGAREYRSSQNIKGGIKIGGGYWFSNDRLNPADGPIYGNWGGQYWSSGKDTRYTKEEPEHDTSPVDSMDAIFKLHDECYGAKTDKYICDRRLLAALDELPVDPRMWKRPPEPEGIEDAKDFRSMAKAWFKFQIHMRLIEREGKNQEYYAETFM